MKVEHTRQGYLQRAYDEQSKLEGRFTRFMFKDVNAREDARTSPNKGYDIEQNLGNPGCIRSRKGLIQAHHDKRADVNSNKRAYPEAGLCVAEG